MPLELRALTVGPLNTNCYILWDGNTRACAIIDPGGDRHRITADISSLGLRVEWILLTHGHSDHSFYAGSLASEYGARIGMHAADVDMLTQSLGIAVVFYDLSEYVPVTPTDWLTDGQVISLGVSELKVIHTPGHSQGGVCFVMDVGVFCGDTVFAGSVGRTDFPGGSFEQLIESIKSKLLVMPDSTPLYPGHGPATTVGEEKRSNPYLR